MHHHHLFFVVVVVVVVIGFGQARDPVFVFVFVFASSTAFYCTHPFWTDCICADAICARALSQKKKKKKKTWWFQQVPTLHLSVIKQDLLFHVYIYVYIYYTIFFYY
jgi:hypothetical protein